jgi:hypothetical protein
MRTVLILLALSAFGVVACSETAGDAPPSPTSAFSSGPSPTGPSGGSGVTGSGFPTTSPGTATGSLASGELTFRLTGDLTVERTLRNLITAVYSPPPGALAIVWTGRDADATVVGIGGATFVGSRPTSTTLSVTLTAQTAEGIASFLSVGGECEVRIEVAGDAEISGGLSCDDLVSSTGEVVDVSASFRAAG